MSNDSFHEDEVFRLVDALIEKPLTWSRSAPVPSNYPVLSFVKFRAFYRAIKGYCSFIQLLKSGQWEDSLVLARSLYELNLNLSEISSSPDPEQAAKKFIRFGEFQQLQLEQKRLDERLRDHRLQSSAQAISEYQQKLAGITLTLDRNFSEFRKPNGKWQKSWCDVGVETLAQRLAKKTGGQRGQSDYFVFRFGSLFTHNTPGSLLLTLPQDRETTDWNEFRAALDRAGRDGLRHFLYEASMCFVDIVGMAGSSIIGYETQWFDEFALPLLGNLSNL